MTTPNYPACEAWTLKQEGGFVDDPRDSGGATDLGITLRTLQRYFPHSTVADLKEMSPAHVSFIYQVGYWRPCYGNDLPMGLDLAVYDEGVNAGPPRSVQILQRTLGLKEDGIVGPVTLAAIAKRSLTDLIAALGGNQQAYYRGLAAFPTFGAGWIARCERRTIEAIAMVPKTGI